MKKLEVYKHSELLYANETYLLRKLVFKVRNELGSGWTEDVYHQALLQELEMQKIPALSKQRKSLVHNGVVVHTFEPDLIVWDKIILEFKALPYTKTFLGEHYAQIIHYLKFWQMNLGLLINWSPPRVNIKRVIWEESPFELDEQYGEFNLQDDDTDRRSLFAIRQLLINMVQRFGTGYPESVYRTLAAMSAEELGIKCIFPVSLTPNTSFRLPNIQTDHLLFNEKYLVKIRALIPKPTNHDKYATKNYLTHMGLTYGLLVCISRKTLHITGVTATN